MSAADARALASSAHPGTAEPDTGELHGLLRELRHRRITLKVADGRLRVSAPEGALDEPLKASLKHHRDALIARLGDNEGSGWLPPIVPRADRMSPVPQSHAQRRLWFLESLEPGTNPFYNIPAAVDLIGPLQLGALDRAIAALAVRHPILVCRFGDVEGVPHIIPARAALPLERADVSGEADPSAAASRLCNEHARRPFDLTREGPARLMLIRLGADHHVLFANTHHIISDGWSMAVIVREICALYGDYAAGKEPSLPRLAIDYADYAAWQTDWLSQERLAGELRHWADALAGVPEQLALPLDRPRPQEESHRGGAVHASLPPALSARLRAVAAAEGTTLFTVLLALFQLLLSRLSGQPDLVVGSPVANRRLGELEALVGFFANTLALRGTFQPGESVRALLARVGETVAMAQAHQDVPFDAVVEHVNPSRSLDRMPLVQVGFALQNAPRRAFALEGIEARVRPLDFGTVRFDLELHMSETAEGSIDGVWIFATDLFDEASVAAWANAFEVMAEAAAANRDAEALSLPLLRPADRGAVVRMPQPGLTPPAGGLHERFAEIARASPDRVAVRCGDAVLRYGALASRAAHLAATLRCQGVQEGAPVAISLPRGVDWPVAILATLWCGAHYVPLDPGHPKSRRDFILADSGARVFITDEPDGESIPTVRVDAAAAEPAPPVGVGPNALAYTIYTSGTSGMPKGVDVTHGNVLSLMASCQSVLDITAEDVWASAHSFAFDFSVFEMWGALLFAGTVVVLPDWLVRSPADALAEIDAAGVTVLSQTPTAFRHLAAVDATRDRPVKSLRCIVFGGETLNPTTLADWVARHGEVPRLVNMYGITETTVHVTHHTVTKRDTCSPFNIVGQPLPHLGLAVVDQAGHPVPDGFPGEIVVFGEGVAQGYRGRDDLTAQRFVAAPAPGTGRAYRSGDLARWRSDGTLEHLGRIDAQINLRGYRIEPGEIEAALMADPRVATAVVLARPIATDEPQLVAYAVPTSEMLDWEVAVRDALSLRLPPHMVPVRVVPIEALPLTANGKLDLAALPDPTPRTAHDGADAPMSAREQLIASVWADTLGCETVGREDNFFALGGDSILSILLVSRLSRVGIKTSTRQIVAHQTVAALSEAAETQTVVAEQEPIVGPVAPTSIQRWFLSEDFTQAHHFNQAIRVRATNGLAKETLEQALHALVVHHDGLRVFVPAAGDGLLAIADPTKIQAPSVLEVDAADGDNSLLRVQSAFSLASAPLMGAVMSPAPGGGHDIVLIVHHLAVDTVSWWILVDDLNLALRALLAGRPAALPNKTSSVREWQVRLERALLSGELQDDLAHWSALVQEVPPRTLGLAPAGPGVTLGRDAHAVHIEISAQSVEAASNAAFPDGDVRVGEIVCAALVLALSERTGREIWLDVEGHGRPDLFDDVTLTRTVGWFTALFPVRLQVPSGTPLAQIGAMVKELRRVPSSGVGYGVVAAQDDALGKALRALPRRPLRFNYLGHMDGMPQSHDVLVPVPGIVPHCHGPENALSYELDVVAASTGGAVAVDFVCAPGANSAVEAVAARVAQILEECAEAAGRFSLAPLDDGQLDALSDLLAAADAAART